MNENAAYTVFFAFSLIWVAIGVVGVIALLKSENQPIRLGKWGLLVSLTTIIPFAAALIVGAIMARTHFTFLR